MSNSVEGRTVMSEALHIIPGRRVLAEERAAVAARAAVVTAEVPPAELAELMRRIMFFYDPIRVWLFGSRARDDARPSSDWDLLVIVDDIASDAVLDPEVAWRLQRRCGVYADVVACRASDFEEDVSAPNTLAFEVGREGRLLHAR